MAQETLFRDVNDYLETMQIRKSLFGYDKEDVLSHMKQIDQLYRDSLDQARAEVERRTLLQVQQEAEQIMRAAEAQASARAELMLEDARKEAEQLRMKAQEEIRRKKAAADEEVRILRGQAEERLQREIQRLSCKIEERKVLHDREMELLEAELERLNQLQEGQKA